MAGAAVWPANSSGFWAVPGNGMRQLIKGPVLWEMYPALCLLEQSQPCEGAEIPTSYVLIS